MSGDEIPHGLSAAAELQADLVHDPGSSVLMVDEAGSLEGDHARPLGRFGRAFLAEQGAVGRREDAPQDVAAAAARKIAAPGSISRPYFDFGVIRGEFGLAISARFAGSRPDPASRRLWARGCSLMRVRATGFPSGRTTRRVFVRDDRACLRGSGPGSRRMPEKDIRRLESGDDSGIAEFPGDELVGLLADDGADVAGIEKAGDPDLARIRGWPGAEEGSPRARREWSNWPSFSRAGGLGRQGDRRNGRFEPDSEEDDLLVLVPAGELERFVRANRRS